MKLNMIGRILVSMPGVLRLVTLWLVIFPFQAVHCCLGALAEALLEAFESTANTMALTNLIVAQKDAKLALEAWTEITGQGDEPEGPSKDNEEEQA